MNVLDAASRIGQQMKTIPLGREWIELYTAVASTVSPEAWDTLLKIPIGYLHYYSFPYAMDIINNNEAREDIPNFLRDTLVELKQSAALQRLCELSVALGKNLNEMVQSTLTPNTIPKDFGQLTASPKLSRSIQDLHTVIQRSRMLHSLFRYLDPTTKQFPTIVDRFYERQRTLRHPLNRQIRSMINDLAQNEEQRTLLSLIYKTDLLLELVKQLVFEAHANRVVEIPIEAVLRVSVRDCGGIQPILVRLDPSQIGFLNSHSSFAKITVNGSRRTILIRGLQIKFRTRDATQFKMHLTGYLYPESDVNVFNDQTNNS